MFHSQRYMSRMRRLPMFVKANVKDMARFHFTLFCPPVLRPNLVMLLAMLQASPLLQVRGWTRALERSTELVRPSLYSRSVLS
jgi:hypothetical protein